ncbi:hypothetical protein OPT61_g8780 [Boeremia exigua]|uniref:Uncharacterized protein n=1 Tax=Boeremia exigua TaxID=749465 RepID=A0ACC2HX63_9PLEO|nr:hypothetical protein OPT61_g8780 [Boeremia exigua]
MAETISPDYLVIGAGAMAMAFVDTLISDTKATIAIVDRYSRPGGHWTIAYPYVTLHQPSNAYGVNSRLLGERTIDQVGLNKGLAELATGDEICGYFGKFMHQTFLPSGRVAYYPLHEYVGEGEFRSITTSKVIRVQPNTRIVEATFMKVKVPAMGPPDFEVSDGVNLIAPNGLAKITRPYGGYTVVGAGKTGVDACLWLLGNRIDPKDISWIMPRDSWFLNRVVFQPPWARQRGMDGVAKAVMAASSPDDMFERFEASGDMLRIDTSVWPTMFRFAVISEAELEQMRRVKNILRKGRIIRLSTSEVTLENGTYEPVPDMLYIDCTADGSAKLQPVPIFNGREIKLQSVRLCQPVFSAAFIAHVESLYDDDEVKNAVCSVIPHAAVPKDFISGILETCQNTLRWIGEPKTLTWLRNSRLDALQSEDEPNPEKVMADLLMQTEGFCNKLQDLWDQTL